MQPELGSTHLVDPTTPNPSLSAAAASCPGAASPTTAAASPAKAVQTAIAKEHSLILRSESTHNLSGQSAASAKRSRIPRPHSFCVKAPAGRLSSAKPDLLPESTPKRVASRVDSFRQDAVRRHSSLGGERTVRRTHSALPKLDANTLNERRKSLPIDTMSNESSVLEITKENLESMSRLENNISTETLVIVGRDEQFEVEPLSPSDRLSTPAKPTRKVD